MNDKQMKEPVDMKQCRKALSNFCKGTYRMCVPAHSDDDDMVLSRALDELEVARTEIERLQESIKHWNHCYSKLSESKQRLVEAIRSGEEIHFATLDEQPLEITKLQSDKAVQRMPEIKFRGKRIDTGEWVTGYLIGKDLIVGEIVEFDDEYFNTEFWCKVDPETVGQYTGLKDLYDGDILHVFEVSETKSLEYSSPIEFIDSGFLVTQPDGCQVPLACFHEPHSSYPLFEIEVIGNIHDHPHLLALAARSREDNGERQDS